LAAMSMRHVPEEWWLFMDASKVSLKAVLLHNGNELPSIRIAYSVHTKGTYETWTIVTIHYQTYEWQVCGDLKVIIAILLRLQKGYTKYCCFLCEWDNRARNTHYNKRSWPKRKSLTPGNKNVASEHLLEPRKVLLPLLHIKLWLMNFVKASDMNGPAFTYLHEKFSRLSAE
jgi:hypothetical protein